MIEVAINETNKRKVSELASEAKNTNSAKGNSEQAAEAIPLSSEKLKELPKRKIFADANYPYPEKMQRMEYEARMQEIQIELLTMQN